MEDFSFAVALRRLCSRCPAVAEQPCVQHLVREQVNGLKECIEHASPRMHPGRGRRTLLPPLPPAALARCTAPGCAHLPLRCDPVALRLSAQESATPQQWLRVLQQLLVLHDVTLPLATLFRPVLLKLVAGVVDAAAGSNAQHSAELAVALLSVLELAPHTEG
jgi:hypothetical protein